MNIVQRARDMIFDPINTWGQIKSEKVSIKDLFVNYAAILALIPAVCSLIGMSIVGLPMPMGGPVRIPFLSSLLGGVVSYFIGLLIIYVSGWVINLLAGLFGSKKDLNSAMALAVFSMTPVWLVGIFSLIPALSILSFVGFYGVYLYVRGLPIMMETPKEKVVLYVILSLLAMLFVSLIIGLIMAQLIYAPLYLKYISY